MEIPNVKNDFYETNEILKVKLKLSERAKVKPTQGTFCVI